VPHDDDKPLIRTASGRFVPPPAAASYDDDDLIVPKADGDEASSLKGSGFGPAPPAIASRAPASPTKKVAEKTVAKKTVAKKKVADPFAEDPFDRPNPPPRVETPSGTGDDPFAEQKSAKPKREKRAEKKREKKSEKKREKKRAKGASAEPEVKVRPRVVLPPPARVIASTGLTESSLEPHEPALPSRKPFMITVAVCATLVVGVTVGGWLWIERDSVGSEAAIFLAAIDYDQPEAALRTARSLSTLALADPEVIAALDRLRSAQVDSGSREAAVEILAGLDAERSPGRRLEICNAALAADSRFPRALLERARARLSLGRTDVKESLADLYTALGSDPEFTAAYLERAEVLLGLGRTQAAQTDLERAVELGGSDALGTLAAAHLKLLEQDAKGARGLYEHTLNRRPDDATRAAATRGLARALLDLGENKRASKLAREAQKLDAHSPASHLLVAEARERVRPDRKASLADLSRALRLDPGFPRALALRSSLELQAGERDAAQRTAEKSLERDSGQTLARLTLAQLSKDSGRLTEASKHVEAAVAGARGGERVKALVLRARIRHAESGTFSSRVRADLDRAIELDRMHPDALSLRAEAKAAAGESDAALDDLDLALRTGAAIPKSYLLRATLNLNRKPAPLRLVIDDLTRALALSPHLTEAYLPRAIAYQRASRYDEALSDLTRATGASPARLALVRADCLYGKGEWQNAKSSYQTFLRLDPRSADRERGQERVRDCDSRLRTGSSDF
jgi:tetratricopeptide (TPR) repeat protein